MKEHIVSNEIQFYYYFMKEIVADIFTKVVFKDQFATCKNKLGLVYHKLKKIVIKLEC